MINEHLSEHELETIIITVGRTLRVALESGEKVTSANIQDLRDQALMDLINDEHPNSLDSTRVLVNGSNLVTKMQEYIATGNWP